jgi:uroporphyrinogen III methyltransferase/synthase
VTPDLVPKTFVAEGVFEALDARLRGEGRTLAGARILMPRAFEAREVLPEAFAAAGATVDVTPLYETVLEDHEPEEVAAVLDANYVSFTSASSAHNFAALLRRDGLGDSLAQVRAASIGPVTSEAVREEGMQVVVEAAEYTIEGLVAALAARSPAQAAGILPEPRPHPGRDPGPRFAR